MKDYIICKPFHLPTKGSSPFYIEDWSYRSSFNGWKINYPYELITTGNQHLYLVSEEEIKEGDWIYDVRDKWLGKHSGKSMHPDYEKANYRKVISTTDKSLSLPLIPKSFIEEYVQEQGRIDEVNIKMACYGDISMSFNEYHEYKPELKDGEVIILPIKDSWNREEVREIMSKVYLIAVEDTRIGLSVTSLDKWFDKNY